MLFDRDSDDEPGGLVAELRLTATDDGGKVLLSAAYGGNASIAVSGETSMTERTAAGAWIEANEGRIEASLYDPESALLLVRERGKRELRTLSNQDP